MAKATIVNETIRQVIDGQTGELLEVEHSEGTRTIYKQEPSYIKLYIQDLLYMVDMPKGLTNVVYALLENVQFANKGLRIYLPTGLKKELIEKLGTTRAAFDNALTKLCKGQIIRRESVGVYALNPYFFGKGEWKDIDKLRMTWNYDAIRGRTFSGQIIRKDGSVEPTGEDIQEPDEDYPDEGEDERLNAEERADRERIAV